MNIDTSTYVNVGDDRTQRKFNENAKVIIIFKKKYDIRAKLMPNLCQTLPNNAKHGAICAKSIRKNVLVSRICTNTCKTCVKHIPNMRQTPENHRINIFIQVQKLR